MVHPGGSPPGGKGGAAGAAGCGGAAAGGLPCGTIAGGLPSGTEAGGRPEGKALGGLPIGTPEGAGGVGRDGIDWAKASAISSAETPPLASDSCPTTESITACILSPVSGIE